AIAFMLALRARWQVRSVATLVAPSLVLISGWFAFFYWIWGTASPSAPYGSSDPMTLGYLAHGAPGLFFDQEYGIVAYAPVLALAIVGFVRMLRTGGDAGRRSIEVIVVLAALVCTGGAFHIWWAGSASPGRHVASCCLFPALRHWLRLLGRTTPNVSIRKRERALRSSMSSTRAGARSRFSMIRLRGFHRRTCWRTFASLRVPANGRRGSHSICCGTPASRCRPASTAWRLPDPTKARHP